MYPNEDNSTCTLLKKLQSLTNGLKTKWSKSKNFFRIQKLENDEHFGDFKPVGNGINELKINYAKGYRVYFKETEGKIIILLIGGDKSNQQKDIEKATQIWNKLKK